MPMTTANSHILTPGTLFRRLPSGERSSFGSRLGSTAGALVLVLALAPPSATAQLGEDELWYDGPASVQPGSNRVEPDIDVDGSQRTVVAWQANTNSEDIYVRRFDVNRTALEDPILVHELAGVGPTQRDPAVAASTDGDFLVVWVEDDSNTFTIRSRHFDDTGSPTGPEREVNEPTLVPSFPGGAHRPDVAALDGGGFVAVWISDTTAGDDGNRSIQGRLLDASGVPTGSQFQVNTTITSGQDHPSVEPLPGTASGTFAGGFVVAWSRPDVHVRRFRSDGTSPENDQQVDGTNDGQRLGLASNDATGQVAVIWHEAGELRVRLFSDSLSPQTATLVANSVTDTGADNPTVAGIGVDGFYLLWDTNTGVGTDDDLSSIQGRLLLPEGVFAGTQFQVNTWEPSNQQTPTIGSAAGRLAMGWRSLGNPDVGGNDDHILGYLRDYCVLFCDDFELGDTSRWSSTSP